jgi:GAF domain-containing protein
MLVEQMIALGDLSKTLDTIVRGIKDVLGCNLVILYTYQQEKNEFSSPTIAGNLRFPEKIAGPVQPNAVPYRIIELDDIYVFKYSQHDLILGSPFAIRENVQSGVAVPLKLNDTKVGVLFINYVGQKHTITPEDLQYIRHFASQAVVAIHNAILYEDVKKRREVLKIIDEAGRTVTSSLHLNKIFKNLAQQAYKLTGLVGKSATLSSISLVEGSHIVLQAVYPPNEKRKILDANADRVDLEKGVDGRIGIIGKAVKEQVSVLVRDVRGNPDYITSHSDTKSELAVPIIYGEKVIGAINLEHDEIAGLDEDDQQNIHALAAHAAVAIQNAHMYRSLERKSHHQGAIYEASKIINASLERTEKQLFDLLAEQMVTEIVPAAEAKNLLGAILIYDSEKKQLELASTYPDGVFGEHVVGEVRSLIQPSSKIGITGQAVLEKRVQRIEDVRKCDSYLNYHPETKSELDVPIMDGEAVLGVLSLESDQFNGFDRDAEDALRAFAELAAIAIQNTRRYQELRDAKAKIGNITAVAWMGLVAAAWRHAIGNKATTIFDTTRLIQKDLEKGASDKHINQRLEKIQSLIAEIRQIPMPPLGNEEGQEDVLIFDLVFDRIKQFENKGRYGDIEYEMKIGVHKLEKVHCSPEWLRRILDILIDNAKEAMKESEVKKMIFTLKYENDGVVILVSDIGRGIPDYQRGNLMNQPIEKKPGEKGAGIGLFLANTVVQTYNGRLEIRSTGPEGTTMAIWLPLLR